MIGIIIVTIPEICMLTSALILNEFDNADKSIARYGQWSVCLYLLYIYIYIKRTKECSFMDVGFGAKLPTFKFQLYHLLDR